MFQPTVFKDGSHILVKDGIPYYSYTGVSFRDRLKNGLSLDYVFDQQEPYVNMPLAVSECEEYLGKPFRQNYVDEPYDDCVRTHARKGKRRDTKKKSPKYAKKSYSVRANGYADKTFKQQQDAPILFEGPTIMCRRVCPFGRQGYSDAYQDIYITWDDELEDMMDYHDFMFDGMDSDSDNFTYN
ncbi:MAG: hypothetical protein ACOVRN_01105 [Flavobacterium sp.]